MTSPLSPARQFLRSSGAMAILYGGSTVLSFLVGVLLARALGASGYGVYALAMTTATLAGLATEFGLPVLVMRETGAARASGDWGLLRGLLGWSDRAVLLFALTLGAATIAGLALFASERSSAYLATLLWAVALVPFVAIGKLRSNALLALDRTWSSQLPTMILRPGLFVLGCAALWWGTGTLLPATAMAVQVGGAAIAMVLLLWLFRRHRPEGLRSAPPRRDTRHWLAACLPMGLSEGLRLLQGQLALILVGVLAGTAQAGIYRVAEAVVQITLVLSSVVGTAATPMFARLWGEQDHAGLERVAVLSAWVMVLGSIALGLPLIGLGEWLFPAIFGAEFKASVPVFAWLWLGMVAGSACGLAMALANMTGHHVLSTRAFGLVALVNLALGALLIPSLGAQGAALASSIGFVAGAGYCALRLKQITGINCTLLNPAALALAREGLAAARTRLSKAKAGRNRE